MDELVLICAECEKLLSYERKKYEENEFIVVKQCFDCLGDAYMDGQQNCECDLS